MPRVRQRRRRRNRERLLLGVLASLTGLFLVLTLVVGYVVWSLERVERLAVAHSLTVATDAPVTAEDIVADALRSDADGFDGIQVHRPGRAEENYLLVGTDSVEGVDEGDSILTDRDGEAANTLADTIMILRLRPDGTAAVVSVPRDLLVEVAGTGRIAKINSSFNIDADPADRAARLIDTVEQNLDIDLQHFVEVDLDGFRKLVDAVGGVTVCFDRAIRDRTTEDSGDPTQGGTGFQAADGLQLLDGDGALQYVRSRHLLFLNDEGVWERLGVWNDLERNSRQQQFVFDAVDQALADALSSPSTLRQLLDIVASNVATSNTISLFDDGLDLARLFRSFDAEAQLERYALVFADVQRAGLTGLGLTSSVDNQRVLDVFRGIGWTDVVESRVSVTVAGEDRSTAAADLSELGFVTSVTSSSAEGDMAVVRYGVGGQLAAVVLASHLRDALLVGDDSLLGNELVLDLGSAPADVLPQQRAVALPPEVVAPPVDGVEVPDPSAPEPPVPAAVGVCS